MVTTRSLRSHYVVTTRSLRAFLFKGPLGATPAKPSKQKLLTEKTWQRQGLISSSRSAKIREPASAIKLKPSNKLDCKIRRVYAVFRRIVELYLTVELLRHTFYIARGTTLSRRFFLRSRRGHDGTVTTRSRRSHGHDRVTTRHDAATTRFVVTTQSRQGHDTVTVTTRSRRGHDEITTQSRRVLWSRRGHDRVTTGSRRGHDVVKRNPEPPKPAASTDSPISFTNQREKSTSKTQS